VIDDRLVRHLYRIRSWLLCRIGRHLWARRRNPEVGGARALYDECRRCGTVRMGWDDPGPGPID
jgi:hypothetical protein